MAAPTQCYPQTVGAKTHTGSAKARVQTALELLAMGEAMLRQRLRRENPSMTDEEIESEVRAWYERRSGPELGVATGRRREIVAR